MFKANNLRIVSDGARLSFQAPSTGNLFVFHVRFRTVKGIWMDRGVVFDRASDAPFPQGAFMCGSRGEIFQPGSHRELYQPGEESDCCREYVLPKRSNACSLTDTDGQNYELFSVYLVDDGRYGKGDSGGVLYFHATAAIPPELGGDGILQYDPTRGFE